MPDSHRMHPWQPRMMPAFGEALRSFDLDTLAAQEHTIYGLDATWRLAYVNPAWFRFAAENDGLPQIIRDWPLGRDVLDACAPELRVFYADVYDAVLRSGTLWEHDFECSSADQYRLLHQTAYPLADGLGLLIVVSPIEQHPQMRDDAVHEPAAKAYQDEDGQIAQCAHCRKTRRPDRRHRWDWVPAWVARPPAHVTHTLCPVCLDHYFPGDD